MKKKRSILALLFALILSIAACGDASSTAKDPAQPESGAVINVVEENLYQYIDTLGGVRAYYVAEIKNNGTVPVELFENSVDLEDATGAILKTADFLSVYPSIIAPGESAYLAEQLVDSSDEIASLDTIGKAILHSGGSEASLPQKPDVEISELKLSVQYNAPKIVGRIENKGTTDLQNLYIITDVRDANGKLQTPIVYCMANLAAGEKKGFEQLSGLSDPNIDFSTSTLHTTSFVYEF